MGAYLGEIWVLVFCFQDKVSLGSLGTQSVGQSGVKLRDSPASVPLRLTLNSCATTAQSKRWSFNLGSL